MSSKVAIKVVRKRTLYYYPRGRRVLLEELAAWQRVTQGVLGKGPGESKGLVKLLEAFDDDQNVYFITVSQVLSLDRHIQGTGID